MFVAMRGMAQPRKAIQTTGDVFSGRAWRFERLRLEWVR